MARKTRTFDVNDALLRISEQINEGARNPNIKKYEPHAKQAIFHSSNRKKKLYIGGNRSGKTTGGVTEDIWRATCTHPYRPDLNAIGPNRGRVVAVDFTQGVEKIIFPQFQQWLYPSALINGSWEESYSSSTRTLKFSNGSTIEFMSYDQKLDKFAGTSRHWVHFDEEPPKPIFTECLARLVDTNGDYWITMTPVEGITWVYEELYEPNIDLEPDDRSVTIVEINTFENPYLTVEGISNLMESMDDEDTHTRIQGGFVRKGGIIYKNFDPVVGGAHVLPDSISDPKTFFPSDRWMWILSLDSGLNNPTAVLWTAVNDDGFAVVFDEWYKSEYTVLQHAEVIKQRIKKHGRYPDLMVADPSITQRSPITKTSIKLEYQKNGLSFIMGNNDVVSGINRVKQYFNTVVYPGSPVGRHPLYGGEAVLNGAIDRIKYKPEEDMLYPRTLIDPRCVNFIKEHKNYRWKTYTDKKKQFENNPYDEPHKKDDHTCDSFRYALMTRPDLAANNNEPNPSALKSAMDQLNEKMVMVQNREIADPQGRIDQAVNGESLWTPGRPLSSNNDWSIDEHMGGTY